jgi:hypothetical protein
MFPAKPRLAPKLGDCVENWPSVIEIDVLIGT